METNMHPAFKLWAILGESLFEAAQTALARSGKARKPKASGKTRRPGADTPLWNVLAAEMEKELYARGAKAALAQRLGIPRQRLNDYLRSRKRVPDAEIALRMLHWLCEKRSA